MGIPQMTEMQNTMAMPQFEVPTQSMPTVEPTPVVGQPVLPEMGIPQMTEMQNTMAMPQFEVPTQSMPTVEPTPVVGQPVLPEMGIPQMTEMQNTMTMPQFEVPTPSMPTVEPTPVVGQPMVSDLNIQSTGVEMYKQQMGNNTQPVMINVMPAVNMIRNLIPLLENSGYKINIEETDNPSEYQIVLKVEK